MWLVVGLLLAQGLGPILQGVTIGAVPGAPANPNPSTLATNISLTPTLICTTPGATTVDIKLDTVNPPVTTVVSGGGSCSYAATLSAGTQYFWQAIAHNSSGTTTGSVWSFTTGSAPGAPNTPSPTNAATGQGVSTSLSWSDTGGTTFDVKFGTVTPPVTTVATGIPALSYTPGGLANGTTYYWQIVAHNAFGNATGPIWSFTTGSLPATPNTPSPVSGSTMVALATTLTWVSAGATTYDVAFGTSSPPPIVSMGQASASYAPTLANSVQYFWQITAHNTFGQAVGPVWSFTTVGTINPLLVQQTNLTYLGSFRVPQDGQLGGGYSGTGFAYNPANNSLFISCNGPGSCQSTLFAGWAEISIPAQATWSKSPTIATDVGAPTATYLQAVTDIGGTTWIHSFDPMSSCGAGTGHYASGAVVYGGNLIWNAWPYYLGVANCPTGSVYSHPVNLSSGPPVGGYPSATQGPWVVGPLAGHVNLWSALVPASWQTALGGPIGVGSGCQATISAVSGGPAFWTFNPTEFSAAPNTNIAATALIDYTVDASGADILGNYNSILPNNAFSLGCQIGGAVIPSNFRSILFLGNNAELIMNTLGLNPWGVYGEGTNVFSQNGTTNPSTGHTLLYDPVNPSLGPHAFPYNFFMWAYDLNDLAAVKAGTKQANQLVPYATWTLDATMTPSGYHTFTDSMGAHPAISNSIFGTNIGGLALDDVNHLIYWAQAFSDALNGPIVNVYSVK